MDNIILRTATLEDLEVLLEFEQDLIDAERPFDTTLKPGKFHYYNIKARILSDEHEMIVAQIGNEIIGSGSGLIRQSRTYFNHESYAYLGFMYVKPAFRGKGVNQKIIDKLMAWAKSRGVFEIRLDVYNDNDSAIRAYEKIGFSKNMVEMRVKID